MSAKRLADAIERSIRGPMWHGSPIADLLEGVTAADANLHPIAGAHSIWQLVLHMSAWAEISRQRLTGARDEPTAEEDWPPIADPSPAEWRAAVEGLKATHRELAADVAALDDARLKERVAGRDYTVVVMLHGVIEHDAYHGGQIAILKRAIARPPT